MAFRQHNLLKMRGRGRQRIGGGVINNNDNNKSFVYIRRKISF